jgi:glycerol-3-phosphate dehydrogenase (NAD(P)+)
MDTDIGPSGAGRVAQRSSFFGRWNMIAILGAGAMGIALATHLARSGHPAVVLATQYDTAVVRAWQERRPHPALGVPFDPDITVRGRADWPTALADAEIVMVAVSSPGLRAVIEEAAAHSPPDAVWAIATKGWQPESLLTPSQVAAKILGDGAPVVALAGPSIAAEIVVGSPTAVLCASRDRAARRLVARTLSAPSMATLTTSDVAGTETASAFKNVAAIAVGIGQGMSERFIESAFVRAFANVRGAMFAQGMVDMVALAEASGGRAGTVVGLAGSGDLYVTCIGGRNGRFGRLLGAGASPAQAIRTIGSTVEGVPNTTAALALAARYSIDLPSARAVELALREELTEAHAMEQVRRLFEATLPAFPTIAVAR